MPPIKIKPYNNKHYKTIANLFTDTIHKTCSKDYTKEQLDAWASLDIDYEFWKERLNKTKPYLAFDGECLVGFGELEDDYINCFYVRSDYQGFGVGKTLLSFLIQKARDSGIEKLRVDASITAKIFFKKFGFIEIKENQVKRNGIILTNFSMQLSL